MSDPTETSATRRKMLVGIAATGAALAGVSATAEARVARRTNDRRFVFRFATRGHRSCKACQKHHRYVIGSQKALLDADRAHPGCNCPIKRQVVHVSQFRKWFPAGEGVIDLRTL